jgi:hypothetical protein
METPWKLHGKPEISFILPVPQRERVELDETRKESSLRGSVNYSRNRLVDGRGLALVFICPRLSSVDDVYDAGDGSRLH